MLFIQVKWPNLLKTLLCMEARSTRPINRTFSSSETSRRCPISMRFGSYLVGTAQIKGFSSPKMLDLTSCGKSSPKTKRSRSSTTKFKCVKNWVEWCTHMNFLKTWPRGFRTANFILWSEGISLKA